MKTPEYDVLAIGGGTAGLVTAAGGAYLGVRSAIVEKNALGGDCLWTGCVPSKAVIASGRLAAAMRRAGELGLESSAAEHDLGAVMARMRAVRETVAHHDDPERFREMGVDVHFGTARLVGPNAVEVEGVGTLKASRIVLATGAVPTAPPIEGLAEVGFLTHETVFGLDRMPRRLLVVGAGPIGLELAQTFQRLGARVDVVEVLDRILPRDDEEAVQVVTDSLERDGVRLHLGARAQRAESGPEGRALVLADGRRLEADQILVATGRRPYTEGLGLEAAGVETDAGAVVADDTLRTSNRSIWAAGDVVGGPQFTHVADAMAKTVLRNALIPGSSKVNLDNVPRVTYTDPEVAHVGLDHPQARDRGGTAYRYGFDDLDRTIVEGETHGFVKVSADKKGRILAATVVGAHAGELVMPLVLARTHGLKLPDIADTVFPYPTRVEGVKRAADAFQRQRLEGLGGSILRKVISWLK